MNIATKKKVLIALDYDPTSLKVAEVGFDIAKAMDAEIILLHVIINLVTYSLTYLKMDPLKLDTVQDMKQASQDFVEKSKLFLGDNMIQTIVKEGDFAESILHTANDMAVDMIIMGSHSTKWLEEIVMGRVTNDVLQQTKIPILIVPTRRQKEKSTLISLEKGD
jgi:nucleotide-binding universal stress UspA family protein